MNKILLTFGTAVLLATGFACSKDNSTTKKDSTTGTASIVNTWHPTIDSIVVTDNGTEVQRMEDIYPASNANDISMFNADGTGKTTFFDNGEFDVTPFTYTYSNGSITINYGISNFNDPAYTLSGTVKSLTSKSLVLYVQQTTTIRNTIIEVTSHHMYYSK